MTDQELQEIEKACAEAPPGPWWLHWRGPGRIITSDAAEEEGVSLAHQVAEEAAPLMAGARTWVPDLVAEVRRLREENRKLRVELIDWESRVRSEREACAKVVEELDDYRPHKVDDLGTAFAGLVGKATAAAAIRARGGT